MTKFNKLTKKLLPRIGAMLLAGLVAGAMYVVNSFIIYTPERVQEAPSFEFLDDPDDPNAGNNKEPIKASDKIFNFLVMGHDRAASLTDVIMLINYNLEKQSVSVMQFPRDTYIEIEDHNYHKVNGLYNYCVGQARNEGSKDPEKDGCKKMADYLKKNLAMEIHYSAVMDLDGFGNIVDAIGGVDMYVPMTMEYNDPDQNLYINLQEGYQHLDGKMAEQFVRFRYGYATGDIGRGDAQKVFISAFINKLLSSMTEVNTIKSLAQNIVNYVDTDIKAEDIVYFGKQFVGIGNKGGSVKLSNVKLMTMPGKATMYGGLSYYVMNREYVANIINDYYNVYNRSIVRSFDSKETFVTSENSVLRDIYLESKDKVDLVIYDAGSIEQNGLN